MLPAFQKINCNGNGICWREEFITTSNMIKYGNIYPNREGFSIGGIKVYRLEFLIEMS